MSSNNSITNQGNGVSSETEALLAEKLEELRDPTTSTTKTLYSIHALVSNENDANVATQDLFIELKGLETIVEATNRSNVGSDFVFQGFRVLFALLSNQVNEAERAAYFIKHGLEGSLEVMERYQTDFSIISAYLTLLSVMYENMTAEGEQRTSIADRVWKTVLPIMEIHKDDGIIFTNASEVLARASLGPGVEVVPELAARAIDCALDGIIRHKTIEWNRFCAGRQLLAALLGKEATMEMLKSHNIDIPEPIVSGETTRTLTHCLAELRGPCSLANEVALQFVETMFGLVLDEANQNETFKDHVYSMKGMNTVIDITKRPGATTYFLHRLGGIMFFLLEDDTSGDRTTHFIDYGGLSRCLEIIQSHKTNGFLVTTYIGVLSVLRQGMTTEQYCSNSGGIFETGLQILELHVDEEELYSNACLMLENSICCYLEGKAELVVRTVQSVFKGLVKHKDHEDAQSSGHDLLMKLLGPEAARKLIDHAEMHHLETATFSSAA